VLGGGVAATTRRIQIGDKVAAGHMACDGRTTTVQSKTKLGAEVNNNGTHDGEAVGEGPERGIQSKRQTASQPYPPTIAHQKQSVLPYPPEMMMTALTAGEGRAGRATSRQQPCFRPVMKRSLTTSFVLVKHQLCSLSLFLSSGRACINQQITNQLTTDQ
jgi:hypothetical protein